MPKSNFSFTVRFNQFRTNLSKKNLRNRRLHSNSLGWLITLIIFAGTFSLPIQIYWQIFLLIHLFFLVGLIDQIYKKFRPPIEVILLLLYLMLLIINEIKKLAVKSLTDLPPSGTLIFLLFVVIVGTMGLLFTIILIHNSQGRKSSLIGFGFIGVIGYFAVASGNDYFIFFFHALLIVVLLQKTRWLEELTKVECWIYIVLLYFFYRTISGLNPFHAQDIKILSDANRWYIITYVFYFFFKYYLLAMLIKIPVVLIYNHASLSRKLKIAGLFQSTFPQLIQFFLLLLIFYSFLAGWQAENLRGSLQERLKEIESGTADSAIQFFRLKSISDTNASKYFKHYQPVYPLKRLSKTGVIEMKRIPASPDSAAIEYFIFTETDSNGFYFVKIDSALLKSLAQSLHYVGGTTLDVYPLTPGKWSSYIYQANFLWQGKNQIRMFPFGALTSKTDIRLSIPFETKQDSSDKNAEKARITIGGQQQIVLGRVFLPLWEKETSANRYLVFDIILKFAPALLRTGLPKVILVLFIVYLLINSFVVRQVVRFGSQINETIVQKFGQLKKGIQQISSGKLDYKIRLEGEDEFVELANHFNQMGEQLKKTIAEVREKDLFEYELKLAREVQLSLLPQQLPEIPGFQIAASMRTANTVGGDFYDIFYLDDHRLLFTIGDVSGKGSSAAMYMAQCMSLVRFSRQFTTDPADISTRLNEYFVTSITDRQIFVTAIIGLLDNKANTINFIRAGHTEPVYIPGNMTREIKFLKTKGLGIGLTRSSRLFKKSLKSYKISFEPGDTLVLYTDGVVEAARQNTEPAKIEMYGEERLRSLLQQHRGNSASEILKEIEINIESFYAGSPRVDDHSLLIIQRSKES